MRVCSRCRRCYDDPVEFCSESDHHPLAETRGGSREMVPGYRLDLLLESGLKGDVYRATEVECGQSCRVRILSPKKRSGQQFLREAKHAAALFHPSLIDVYEAGSLASGQLFIVSEEPAGQTLREYLTAATVPPLLSTIEIMNQTAEALHAIHQEGLLHRAVRPENIILANDVDGRSLVQLDNVDFGGLVERSIVGNKFLIDTALDAVRYFAPEQFTGDRPTVRSDVYALGIILYEMLAGAPPFNSPKASGVIEKHRHQKPKEIRIDNFELRALLTHTLNESLQKEPSKRHSTAQAFARQLRHMEQLATHVSTPPPAITVPPIPELPRVARTAAAAAPARSKAIEPIPEPDLPLVNVEPGHKYVDDRYDPWLGSDTYSAFEYPSEPSIQPKVADAELAPEPAELAQIEDHLPKPRLDRASRLARTRLRNHRSRPKDLPAVVEQPVVAEPPTNEIDAVLPDHLAFQEPVLSEPPQQQVAIDEPPAIEIPVQSLESPAAPSFIEPEPDEITAVAARREPAVIEWQLPEDDIPSVDDVIEALANENTGPSFDVDQPTKPEQPPAKPRKQRPQKPSDEIQFLPSVMRKSDEVSSLDLYPNYSILSGYGASQTNFNFDYQTLVLGVGLIALVLLFFVGSSMFRQRYVTSQPPAVPQSIQSVFSEPDPPQVAQANTAKKAPKALQKTKTDDVGVDDNVSSPPPTPSVSERRPQPVSSAPNQDQTAKNTLPTRSVSKPSPISSTLVISTENGRVKSTVQSPNRPAEQKPPIATNIVTGSGRPRIAGNQTH